MKKIFLGLTAIMCTLWWSACTKDNSPRTAANEGNTSNQSVTGATQDERNTGTQSGTGGVITGSPQETPGSASGTGGTSQSNTGTLGAAPTSTPTPTSDARKAE
jgi:hypothetical protein